MKRKVIIVFDMDGVLIDVRGSYQETVRQTARLFFKGAKNWEHLPEPLFPLSDLANIKMSGGLNNDWDLTCLSISLLFSLVKRPECPLGGDNWGRFRREIDGCDVSLLARFLISTDRPLSELLEREGNERDPFVNSLYKGDVGGGNVIKRIFQELYLGKRLFETTYKSVPKVYTGEGYINREKLLVKRSTLRSLAERSVLAIATGRPEEEAQHALSRFNIEEYFTLVFTLNDCHREEREIFRRNGKRVDLSKPNPFMLNAITDSMDSSVSMFFYVGDTVDDMEAAVRARERFIPVGVVEGIPEKESLAEKLLKAGAKYIINSIEELKDVIAAEM